MSEATSVYEFNVPTSTDEEQSLKAYEGKVMLIVNTASKCGFTPQYEGLQKLHNSYGELGLEIIAMPCNQFGGQEPGSNAEVQEFCQMNYGLSFPVMGPALLDAYIFRDTNHKNKAIFLDTQSCTL